MRNETNRLTEPQKARLRAWLEQLSEPPGDGVRKRSQHELARLTGASQALISQLLAGGNTTRGTAVNMLQRAGGDVGAILGTDVAQGKYQGKDTMSARGYALDALNAVYDEEFCDTIQAMTPPPESEKWTTDQWVDHIVTMRKLWHSGHLGPKRLKGRPGK